MIYQVSDWNYRWFFEGGGSIPFEIRVGHVRPYGDGRLIQWYHHAEYGNGRWVLDEETFEVVENLPPDEPRPAELEKPKSEFPGVQVIWAGDSGRSGQTGIRYHLRWETLGPHRDRPREGDIPDPFMLTVYKIGSDQ